MNKYFAGAAVVLMLAVSPTAKADTVASIGNTASGFVSGATRTTLQVTTAQSGQASPFNSICGSDTSGTSCSGLWTFNNSALGSGETITGATLTFGIWDLDSKATGFQVSSFMVGGDDLTAVFNSAAEALNGGTGSINSEYDVFTFTMDASSFAALALGNTNASLALKAPGSGVLGDTKSNGAGLVFSTLDVHTAVAKVPEPSTLALLFSVLGSIMAFNFLAAKRARRS